MRDRNQLDLEQFHIQLRKKILLGIQSSDRFSRHQVPNSPTLLDLNETDILYPRSFRLLRTLFIIHWYLPEVFFWRIHLDLEEMNLNHLTFKQQVELKLYLVSKEKMIKYLYRTQRFTGNELFGNFLGNDLEDLLKVLRFRKRRYRLLKGVYRRGYRDHGARKPDHRWLPTHDFTLTEMQIEKELASEHLNKLVNRLESLLD